MWIAMAMKPQAEQLASGCLSTSSVASSCDLLWPVFTASSQQQFTCKLLVATLGHILCIGAAAY